MGKPNEPAPYYEPELPIEDELGQDCIEYNCWTCKRSGYMAREAADMLWRHNQRFLCLPCKSPWLWKWEQDEEAGREWLTGLTRQDEKRLLRSTPGGEERKEYTGALATLQLLRERRNELGQTIEKAHEDLESVELSIPIHEKIVMDLSKKMQVATDNAVQVKRDEIKDLVEKIAALKAQIAGAKS